MDYSVLLFIIEECCCLLVVQAKSQRTLTMGKMVGSREKGRRACR